MLCDVKNAAVKNESMNEKSGVFVKLKQRREKMSSDEHGVRQLLAMFTVPHWECLCLLFGKMDTPAVIPLITG